MKKTPEWAAEITGVPAQKIRAFAQDLAAHRTMIMFGYGMQRAQYGEQTSWMVVTLAAVLGRNWPSPAAASALAISRQARVRRSLMAPS